MAADLARRARWLERYRRPIARGFGLIAAAFLWFQLPCWLGAEWPRIHAHLSALVGGVLIQIAVDFVLIVLLAWWEVQLGRSRGADLPHAIVVERPKS